MNKKDNVKIIIITIMKLIRTMIGNQIEIVNENKYMKNDKNIKEINDKKINNKKNMK